MAYKQPRMNNQKIANPAYAWLEKTRQSFINLAHHEDPAMLHGIIAEGLARLKNAPPEDPLLGGYLQLTIAEAHFNLALAPDDSEDIRENIIKGKRLCEKAAKEANEVGCGTAANILPRAITLLSAIYNALPEAHETGLAKSLENLASSLDLAMVEQRVLREKADDMRQVARLLVAGLGELSPDDRRSLLIHSADQMMRAGELYLQAGDMENVASISEEIEALQASLLNPEFPIPALKVFKEKIRTSDLLPDLPQDASTEDTGTGSSGEVPGSEPDARLQPARKQKSALRWVLSLAGMLISCVASFYSGYRLVSGFSSPPAAAEDDTVQKTQMALAMTRVAGSAQQTQVLQGSDIQPNSTGMEPTMNTQDTALNPSMTGDGENITLTGNQAVSDYSIFDDFSSQSLNWQTLDDGRTVIQYEDGGYTIQVKEPGAFELAYFPVNFAPYEVQFDIQGPQGDQDGTFGVFCQFQDRFNYYYVEMDLQTREYVMKQIRDSQIIPLTSPNESGSNWQRSNLFSIPATSVNHIGVSCYLDSITLYINNQLADTVSIPQPFDQPGLGALFVYTYEFAGEDGYKVFFDNVEIYYPVQ